MLVQILDGIRQLQKEACSIRKLRCGPAARVHKGSVTGPKISGACAAGRYGCLVFGAQQRLARIIIVVVIFLFENRVPQAAALPVVGEGKRVRFRVRIITGRRGGKGEALEASVAIVVLFLGSSGRCRFH